MTEYVDWHKALPALEVYEREPLRAHTTFRIGGPARWLLCPKDEEEAAEILKICKKSGIKPFFLGNGSNVLAADEGYDGVIVSTVKMKELTAEGTEIVAGSGVSLARLASFAAEKGLTGLEFAQGIPGSVGGGTRMNAGAYGGELGNAVRWVEALDETGEKQRICAEECDFSYRHSAFCEKPLLIISVLFSLKEGERETILAQMADFAQRRREKQPLEYPSAGSTFKRPEGYFAAALVDQCGLKGLQVGGAQVSEKHAGFVVNAGNATAADVRTLMERVQTVVEAQTGVRLEPEVEFLG